MTELFWAYAHFIFVLHKPSLAYQCAGPGAIRAWEKRKFMASLPSNHLMGENWDHKQILKSGHPYQKQAISVNLQIRFCRDYIYHVASIGKECDSYTMHIKYDPCRFKSGVTN
jgi:hypothetical protein